MLDTQSSASLSQMSQYEKVREMKVPGVRTVLIVMSARGMVYDTEALRQKVHVAYPEAAIFFQTTQGTPIGPASPKSVDLLIDLTGPGQRQGLFYAKKLRRHARFAVGRNSGLFRKRIYDRICDEKKDPSRFPNEMLARERQVQKEVFRLAGVAFLQAGETPGDLGKTLPLELPPLAGRT